MAERSVIITGSNGGIGQELCRVFSSNDYKVIGVGRESTNFGSPNDEYMQLDLDELCTKEEVRAEFLLKVKEKIGENSLKAVINNAALQAVKPVSLIKYSDLLCSMNVNVFAPYLLVQGLLPLLEASRGCVINISSIHAALTKPEFSPYAISKAAMDGMTRTLAVELGKKIRVNAIAPAAIATPMLEEGFKNKPAEFQQLNDMHPSGKIGEPNDVANLALYLASEQAEFMNGSIIGLDGGIRGRLHDPV